MTTFLHRYKTRAVLGLIAVLLALVPAATDYLRAGAIDAGTHELVLEGDAEFHYESETPMVASDPAGEFHDPENCPPNPACTMITLETKATSSTPDVYFLGTELDWAAEPVGPRVIGVQGSSNDLDMYVFVYRQAIDEDTDEPEYDEDGEPVMEYAEIARGASSDIPEFARLFGEGSETFYIVVSNFTGVNQTFTLDVTYEGGSFGQVFEDLPDDFDASAVAPPPPTPSATSAATPAPPAPATLDIPGDGENEVALPPPAPVETDFADVSPSVQLDDILEAAPTAGASSLFETREVGPPSPVSDTKALLWLALVPAIALAAGAGLLLKFRPKALRVAVGG